MKLKQEELEKYASEVMMLDEKGETFVQKLNRLFMEAGTHLAICTRPA